MGTNTTNLGLYKPAREDNTYVVTDVNNNMDKIDLFAGKVNTSISGLANGIAIVSVGNTHSAITSGQYVYVKDHGTLAEGLYTANSNIAANAALTSSNLTAVSGGGLNAVYNSLNSKIDYHAVTSGDFDNLTGNDSCTTWYRGENISNFTNAPSAIAGNSWPFSLEVISVGQTYKKQVLTLFAVYTNGMAYTRKFERQQTYSSGSIIWGGWDENVLNRYTDVDITLGSSDLCNTQPSVLTNKTLLSASFIYTNDFYYAILTDSRQLSLSFESNGTVSIIQKGGTRTTNRTIKVRVHYV